jgi:hypothetical protein
MLNGVPLTNTPKVESDSGMLGALLTQFGAIVNHESVNGIPEPVRPSLIQDRKVLAQDSQFISQLVRCLYLYLSFCLCLCLYYFLFGQADRQRQKATELRRQFWETYIGGVFEAFKMTRDRVPSPKQYIGKRFKKMFANNEWYTGTIQSYDDEKQWWSVTYEDGDAEV